MRFRPQVISWSELQFEVTIDSSHDRVCYSISIKLIDSSCSEKGPRRRKSKAMTSEQSQTMTQDELVQDLHLLGYQDVSVGRVAEWRKLGLLPVFMSAGEGQGRGAGRKKGFWSNPAEV